MRKRRWLLLKEPAERAGKARLAKDANPEATACGNLGVNVVKLFPGKAHKPKLAVKLPGGYCLSPHTPVLTRTKFLQSFLCFS
jgi:hypothetical protein